MDLFGRASWLTFLAGALPTGLAGWWIGTHPHAPAAALLAAGAASLAVSLAFSWLARRWFVLPLRELERGLERWTRGDLGTPLDESKLGGWRRLGPQFARAQNDLALALAEAKAGLALERARLEALVEKLPDAIIMTNLRGEVVFLNAPALPLLGAGPRDAEPGRRALLVPRDPARWRARFQELLKAHSGGGVYEVAPAGGGPASSYKTAVSMFSDPVTGDFGVLMILRDVTAERRLDALKEEFFQAAAHDLRAPLFAVSGFLRLLRRSFEPDGRQSGWLDQIDQSVERLTMLVKDTLDSARIESGRLRLSPAPVDARALLRRAARLFQPLADERRIVLDVRVPDEAPVIEADERLLERLLHNLLSNAVKFTPPGGHVTIEAIPAGADVELAVTDTGPGIPEAQRTAVFEKFRQLDPGQTRSGFGLGLNICAKIVKLHGGVIWVQKGPTGGAQFVVRLPLSRRTKEPVQ
ncbi:MAG: PAS domain-containing sensor histidine kinase [Elusimicrobiota bacterium]|nr:PAS domain-containing sensor histidine kinase [Elusimicrobiota bacterium]